VVKLQSNSKIFGWFVDQVMKATQGQANAQLVNEALKRALGG
jgi:Asp-tRNA(Asn)/Glu-tRNA(Gln) amidotransferase B subunit